MQSNIQIVGPKVKIEETVKQQSEGSQKEDKQDQMEDKRPAREYLKPIPEYEAKNTAKKKTWAPSHLRESVVHVLCNIQFT